eukprot:4165572-Lingulodinium_polyedra.AAC.1
MHLPPRPAARRGAGVPLERQILAACLLLHPPWGEDQDSTLRCLVGGRSRADALAEAGGVPEGEQEGVEA